MSYPALRVKKLLVGSGDGTFEELDESALAALLALLDGEPPDGFGDMQSHPRTLRVGTDQQFASVQEAIDSIEEDAEGPTVILVYPGVYYSPDSILLDKPNVCVVGVDRDACVLESDVAPDVEEGGDYGATVSVQANNCAVSNLTIRSTYDGEHYKGLALIVGKFSDGEGTQVYPTVAGARIANCTITSNPDKADTVYILESADDVVIRGCFISGYFDVISSVAWGGDTPTRIEDCTIQQFGGTGSACIWCGPHFGTEEPTITHIINCRCIGTGAIVMMRSAVVYLDGVSAPGQKLYMNTFGETGESTVYVGRVTCLSEGDANGGTVSVVRLKQHSIETIGNVTVGGTITGNGSGLSALNASNISSGTLSASRLPVGLTLAAPTSGTDRVTLTLAAPTGGTTNYSMIANGDVRVDGALRFNSASSTVGIYLGSSNIAIYGSGTDNMIVARNLTRFTSGSRNVDITVSSGGAGIAAGGLTAGQILAISTASNNADITIAPNGTGKIRCTGGSAFQPPKVSSDPGSPAEGDIWYNTTSGTFKCYQGGAVKTITVA